MRLSPEEARRRLAPARVARLATVDAAGHPHQVPAAFAVRGDTLVTAVDHKPKRHQGLKRLRNIAVNPGVCVLADAYDEDWSRLWWTRADGLARVLEPDRCPEQLSWLREKYPQYRDRPPDGPVIEIAISRWTGWAAADPVGPRAGGG
jgi:PPOX class probable F420-dependent enzyme